MGFTYNIMTPAIFAEGGNVNDEIPIEVLFKYLHRDFKNMKEIAKQESEKVKQLKNIHILTQEVSP